MAKKGITFRGQSIIVPGVASYVNASEMLPNRGAGGSVLAVVGPCGGGEPNVAHRVNGLTEAIELVKNGNLKTALELIYDPSGELPGAGEVIVVRPQATTTPVALATSPVETDLTLSSADYGARTNFLRWKIEAGTVAGTKKFTVENQLDDSIEVIDNLGKLLEIHYTGSGAAATLDIDPVTLKNFKITVDAATLLDYDLTSVDLNTLSKLVTTLNAHSDLTVTIKKEADGAMDSILLDALASEDIKTAAYTCEHQVGALYSWITEYSELLTVAQGAAFTGELTVVGWTNFTGGSDGSVPSAADWATALAVLEDEEDIGLVYVTAEDAAIHASALTHCSDMSKVTQAKERILICGGAANESVDDVTTRAIGLNDARAALAYPGISRYNTLTGKLDALSPAYLAAICAGMSAGISEETPLTNKAIRVQGIETTLDRTDLRDLLSKGVMVAVFDKGNSQYKIVQGLTTYQKDGNVIYRKVAGMRIHDRLNKGSRSAAEPYIGKVGDALNMVGIKNSVEVYLQNEVRDGQNPSGILTPVIDNGTVYPAYKNVNVTYDGLEWITLSFDAYPVGEIAYVTITANMKAAEMIV